MEISNLFVTENGELLLYSEFFNSCFKVIGYSEPRENAIFPLYGIHGEQF